MQVSFWKISVLSEIPFHFIAYCQATNWRNSLQAEITLLSSQKMGDAPATEKNQTHALDPEKGTFRTSFT